MKIIYIVGFGRSGTTILGNLLGALDGFFHMGEIERFWWRMATKDEAQCGCGARLTECEFWNRVLSAYDVNDLPRETPDPDFIPHFFARIASTADARVLIDSSKSDSGAQTVQEAEGIDPYFIHMVRDPRGCVLSRQKKRLARSGSQRLDLTTAVADSFRWMQSNLKAELLAGRRAKGRTLFIRYEDFVADPRSTVERVCRMVGETPASSPFLDATTAVLDVNHTVGGNRNRFSVGKVEIRLDTGWLDALKAADRRIITLLTLPLLLKYKYPLTNPASAN